MASFSVQDLGLALDSAKVYIISPVWEQLIPWTRLCSMGQARLQCRLTIGLLVHSQCVGIIVSPACAAQIDVR